MKHNDKLRKRGIEESNASKFKNMFTTTGNIALLPSNIILLTLNYSKKLFDLFTIKTFGSDMSAKWINEYKWKIEAYNSWLMYIIDHYSNNEKRKKILDFAESWYDTMANQNNDILQEYLQYFNIKDKNGYLKFIQNNLQKACEIIKQKSTLAKRYHHKKIPKKSYVIPFLMPDYVYWYCESGWGDSNLYVDLWWKLNNIGSTTVHEWEHFFQNAIAGNLSNTKNFDEEAYIWKYCPLFQPLFHDASEIFSNLSISVKVLDNSSETHFQKNIDALKTILFPKEGYWDFREIFARIRQIKYLLWIDKDHQFSENDIKKLDWMWIWRRKKFKKNIIDQKKFIILVNTLY